MRTLHEWRLARRLTLKDIADELKVHPQTVWEWDHGLMPSLRNQRRIVEMLHIDFDEIDFGQKRASKKDRAA